MKTLFAYTATTALLAFMTTAYGQQAGGQNDRKGGSKPKLGQQQNREVQQRSGQKGGEKRGGRGQGGGGLFRLLDFNRDGKLSAKEIDDVVAVLMKLDSNKDGVVDAAELASIRGGQRRGAQDKRGQGGQQKGQKKPRGDAKPRRGEK